MPNPPIANLEALGYLVGIAHSDSGPLRELIANAEATLADPGMGREERRGVKAQVKEWVRETRRLDGIPTIYGVRHDELGLSMHVAEDDAETWASLSDPDLHAKRLLVNEVNADPSDGRMLALADGEIVEVGMNDDAG